MPEPIIDLPAGYILNPQFSDEFEGTTLDLQKWHPFALQWYGREPGYFEPKNVSVKNGCLVLTARKQDPAEVTLENKLRGYDLYTTAFVQSNTRIGYGYYEIRFKSMSATVCNAFWLHDPLDPEKKYVHGDFSEEIDILEVFGKNKINHQTDDPVPEQLYWTTLHRFPTPYVEAKVNDVDEMIGTTHKMPFKFYQDFHIGGLFWDEKVIRWYLDGKLLWEQPNIHYHRPMYLNVDCEIMLPWVGLPEDSDLPSEYQVDYIRVWQKQ